MWTKWPDFYVTDLYIITPSLKPGVVWRIKYFSFSCCMEESCDTLRSCDCSLMTWHVCNYLTYSTVIFQWHSNDVHVGLSLTRCWVYSLCYGCSHSSKLRKSLWEWTSSSSSSSRYLAAQLRSASWDQNLHSAVVLLCNVQGHRARWEQIQSFKHFSDRGNDRMFHRHWSCSLINLKISQDKLIKFYFNIDFYKLKCTWLITGTKSIKSWTRTP